MNYTVYQGSLGLNFIQNNLIPFLINSVIFILVILSLIFVVVGGIRWITSAGEKEGMASAKGTITWALIGLVVGISAFIILGIIGKLLDINLLGAPKVATYIGP